MTFSCPGSSNEVMTERQLTVLNVGGTKYTTTVATLTNPIEPNSFFAKMYSGAYAVTDETFLDRDGGKFAYILEYLRTSWAARTPKHLDTESLLREAVYFGLDNLVKILTDRCVEEQNKPMLEVGKVETLPPGTPAYIKNVGTEKDVVLQFGIPQGLVGMPGPRGPPTIGPTEWQ